MTQITSSGFPGFSTNFTRFEASNGITYLQATSLYLNSVDNTCTGTLITETCDFRLSINAYQIMYQNYTLTINSLPTLVQYSSTDDDLPNAPFGSPTGLLSGLNAFVDTYLASNSTVFHGVNPLGQEFYIALSSGDISASFLNLTDQVSPGGLPCQLQWNRPTEYIKGALNVVAFYAALTAGYEEKNPSDLKSFIALQTQPVSVYVSDYGYLGATMFIHAIAILTVSLTLYGFWQIGHETTLSPMQTGRALGAPILAGGEAAGAGEKLKTLITEVGKKEVKYGVVASDGNNGTGAQRLGITHPHLLIRHFRN